MKITIMYDAKIWHYFSKSERETDDNYHTEINSVQYVIYVVLEWR